MTDTQQAADTVALDGRVQVRLNELGALIIATAASLPEVGKLEQTLKWGQMAFLPVKARIGTTIRIDAYDDNHIALFVHCQTSLVETFKTLFPEFRYEGNRALILPVDVPLPTKELSLCIEAALTYHLRKRR